MNFKMILGLFLVFLIVLFTLQNTDVVTVRLLFWELLMSRAILIFLVLGIGIVLGWILRSWAYHKKI